MTGPTRRNLLLAGVSVLGGIAGCLGRGTGTTTSGEPRATDGTGVETTGTAVAATTDRSAGTATATDRSTATAELDLREANVVGVEFEAGENYRFDVTLYHDDDGEAKYANWWQVERLDGTRLGRRTLLHAHSTDPFTRSERIDVPEGVTCVVVRGHDQIHGYGGRAMLVNLETGATRAVDQGSGRQSFDESNCP